LFIHLGGNQMLRLSDIVAIVDVASARKSALCKLFPTVSDDVKSFVITAGHIYPSPISSNTLQKRSQLSLKVVSIV
jgi:hypothetical protein